MSTSAVATAESSQKHAHLQPKPRKESRLEWVLQHQSELALLVLIPILFVNALLPPEYVLSTAKTPTPSYHLKAFWSRFVYLSYRKPDSKDTLFLKSRDDAYVVVFWFFLFAFLRDAVMRWILTPLAKLLGVKGRRSLTRFAEQGWSVIYYSVFWAIGFYMIQNSPSRNMVTKYFFIDYPHVMLPPLQKWYSLAQIAFWFQQMVVLNLEAPRKDHVQMMTHHVVTIALMLFSYMLNWTGIGTAVLVVMDFSDILLSFSKIILYTGFNKAADCSFALFLVSWFITRHYYLTILIWSIVYECPMYMKLEWAPEKGVFSSKQVLGMFVGLLSSLEIMMCVWTTMILKVTWKIVRGQNAEDSRSEAGDDTDTEEEEYGEESKKDK